MGKAVLFQKIQMAYLIPWENKSLWLYPQRLHCLQAFAQFKICNFFRAVRKRDMRERMAGNLMQSFSQYFFHQVWSVPFWVFLPAGFWVFFKPGLWIPWHFRLFRNFVAFAGFQKQVPENGKG